MPAQWTGKIVGEIHNNSLTAKELAKELDWNEKYTDAHLLQHQTGHNGGRLVECSTRHGGKTLLSEQLNRFAQIPKMHNGSNWKDK